ncbi:hypothetical protein DVK01_18300 [Haloarcula sp. Atlit-120R]|nr:hypothetical protein DVK01_18300 [Haloarcula sp. Atlit-120R]
MSINRKINSEEILSDALNDFPDWFSDIGATADDDQRINNSDLIRKWHHILSWHFIKQKHDTLGFENFHIANVVANVCKVHREGVSIEHLNNSETIRANEYRGEIHTEAIAALFQFADALDVIYERAPEISTETQVLPEESEPHWRVKHLINDFYYDPSEKTITFNAFHENEHDKKLLENIAADLYSEYYDVKSTIASEPYSIPLIDIYCETTHRESTDGGTVRLSGEEAHIVQFKQEGEKQKREQASKFEEIDNGWVFEILNDAGDTRITRDVKIRKTNNSLEKRTHFVRCYDSKNNADWESVVQAEDKEGNELDIEVEIDQPKHKRFTIDLPEESTEGDTIEYTYSYRWNGFFPKENEEFEIKGNAPSPDFELTAGDDLSINSVWWVELSPDDNSVIDRQEIQTNGNSVVTELDKAQNTNNVCVHWTQL